MIKAGAVLFDLYNTLVYGENWEKFWEQALKATVKYLNSLGFKVGLEDFSRKYVEIHDRLLKNLERTSSELDLVYLYWRLLKELGFTPSINLVKKILDVFYDIEVCSLKSILMLFLL